MPSVEGGLVGARDSGGPPGCGGRFKASGMVGLNTGGAKGGRPAPFRPGGGLMPGGGGSKPMRGGGAVETKPGGNRD